VAEPVPVCEGKRLGVRLTLNVREREDCGVSVPVGVSVAERVLLGVPLLDALFDVLRCPVAVLDSVTEAVSEVVAFSDRDVVRDGVGSTVCVAAVMDVVMERDPDGERDAVNAPEILGVMRAETLTSVVLVRFDAVSVFCTLDVTDMEYVTVLLCSVDAVCDVVRTTEIVTDHERTCERLLVSVRPVLVVLAVVEIVPVVVTETVEDRDID